MAKFAVIGLGKFGFTVATELTENGAEVIAIDMDQNLIDEIAGKVTYPVRMNSTNEEDLKKIGIRDVDAAILAIGNNLEVSVLTAVILKKLGVGRIYAKVDSQIHARVLEMLGIPKANIIFPEKLVGTQLANSLLSQTIRNYIDLHSGFSFVEIEAPKIWYGKTLQELALPMRRQVNVVAIKYMRPVIDEDGESALELRSNDMPGANDVIHEGDVIVLVGKEGKVKELILDISK